MKISKLIYAGALSLLTMGFFSACDDDLQTYTVSTPAASTLEQSINSIVISEDNLKTSVYTLKFSATDANLEADVEADLGAGVYIIEASLDPSFPANATKSEVIEVKNGNNSKTYSGTDLDIVALGLGAKPDVKTTLYFRINHTYSEKTAALGTSSNVVELSITPLELLQALNVVSKDGSTIITQLVYNEKTKLYEGEYSNTEWDFYLVDAISGVVYGCDDDNTKGNDGVDRSCKLVANRTFGSYNHWIDPSVSPITMTVDLEKLEWKYARIATEKKDLTGVTVLIVGNDMGWHENWTPSDDVPGVVVTKNGDEYKAVFENVTLTQAFGFRATSPASAWIGLSNFKEVSDLIGKASDGNAKANENGVYKITFIAVAESDGSISYKLEAEKTGGISAKDFSNVPMGIKADWDKDESTEWTVSSTVTPIKNSDGTYTYQLILDCSAWMQFGFDFDGAWVGKDNVTLSSENGNLIQKWDNNLGVNSQATTIKFIVNVTSTLEGITYEVYATEDPNK